MINMTFSCSFVQSMCKIAVFNCTNSMIWKIFTEKSVLHLLENLCFHLAFSQLIMKHWIKIYLTVFMPELKVFGQNDIGEILNQAQILLLKAFYRIIF